MQEPGLDRHDYETQWQGLEPLLLESPAEALPEAEGLVGRMLREQGLDPGSEEVEHEDAGELVLEYRQARETAHAIDAGEDVDPGDVGAAVLGLRNVYEQLLESYRAP